MNTAGARRRLRRLLIAVAVVLLVTTGLEGYRTYRLAADLRDAAADLQAMAQGDPAALDLQAAARLVHEARLDAEALQIRTRLLAPLTNWLGWVPRYGPTLAAAAPMADYAASLTAAGDEVLGSLEPLLAPGEPAGSAGNTPLAERLVETIVSGGAQLDAAQTYLEAAGAARQHFVREDLPLSLQDNLAQVDRLLPLAQQGLTVLRLIPALLGAEAPRTYLLVAQNQDELRATGGFISGIGTVVFDRGRIADLSIGDSYSVDDHSRTYPLPPEPLQRYMQAGQWFVRDANWSPDFPTSAVQIRELYTFSTGKETDGLIAFDLTALARILGVTGPVRVERVSEPVGAGNVEAYIHQAWAPAPGQGITQEWWEHRKDFMGELAGTIVSAVQTSSDRGMLLALAREALALMREKHLLIAMDDPEISALLSSMRLDGALHTGLGDFLMLVDTNVGFNKVDPRVERSLSYTVDLRDPQAPRAEVAVRYRHTIDTPVTCVHQASYGSAVYEDLQTRCYWDYVRVYAPSGALLLGGRLPRTPAQYLLTGQDEPGMWTARTGEPGTTEFSGIFVLPTAKQAELRLAYRLPDQVLLHRADGSRVYSLRLYKQPGTQGTPVEVTVLLPEGATLRAAEGWTALSADTLHWQGLLVTDVTVSLTFGP